LPTCENFYNIYHPSDLVAYRIEPIIKPHPKRDSNNITNSMTSNVESCLKDSQEEENIPPPVLVPCYWNKGMNYS